jgi:membrane protein DedA with SNARE-associated domain
VSSLSLYAGGSVELVLAAGALGAWAGDIVGFWSGRRRPHDFESIWPNSWTRDAADRARRLIERLGILGIFPSKFHTTLRSFGPAAAGAKGIRLLPFALASAVSCIPWAILCSSPGIVLRLLGW